MSRRNKELDNFVDSIVTLNEAIKRQANTGVQGIDDMVEQMAKCEITRQHLPDHVIDILLGDTLLGGVKDVETTVFNLSGTIKKVAAPGDETLGALVPEWMKSQKPEGDVPFEKKMYKR